MGGNTEAVEVLRQNKCVNDTQMLSPGRRELSFFGAESVVKLAEVVCRVEIEKKMRSFAGLEFDGGNYHGGIAVQTFFGFDNAAYHIVIRDCRVYAAIFKVFDEVRDFRKTVGMICVQMHVKERITFVSE